jgi:hypothetical protein
MKSEVAEVKKIVRLTTILRGIMKALTWLAKVSPRPII